MVPETEIKLGPLITLISALPIIALHESPLPSSSSNSSATDDQSVCVFTMAYGGLSVGSIQVSVEHIGGFTLTSKVVDRSLQPGFDYFTV